LSESFQVSHPAAPCHQRDPAWKLAILHIFVESGGKPLQALGGEAHGLGSSSLKGLGAGERRGYREREQ
jgi:hypothetical protein